jgi:hypothetical protein
MTTVTSRSNQHFRADPPLHERQSEATMTHDLTTRERSRPDANREALAERALVDTIMQPFMGNQAWAELVTPKPSPEPPGALAVAAGDPWLAGEAYMTASFLSGLS